MNRLQQHLASLVALESQLEADLDETLEHEIEHAQAAAALTRLHATVKGQHTALEARLKTIASDDQDSPSLSADPLVRATENMSGAGDAYQVSAGLHTIFTLVNQAIFGYAILQALTHRYRDSKVAEGPNTADISAQHTRSYTAAAQDLNQLIHDVVLWELNRAGDECRCTCPSCSLGICLCAVSSRAILNNAWADANTAATDGTLVHLPRAGSAAASAGLREGDVVLSVGGEDIHAPADQQAAIRKHETGDEITLRVRRGPGDPLEITVTRP